MGKYYTQTIDVSRQRIRILTSILFLETRTRSELNSYEVSKVSGKSF